MIAPLAKPTPRRKEPKPLKSRPHVIPAAVKQQVFDEAKNICEWCKVPGGRLDCHHRLPRSRGGKDDLTTLIACHRLCHSYIHEHPAEAKRRGFLA